MHQMIRFLTWFDATAAMFRQHVYYNKYSRLELHVEAMFLYTAADRETA